MSPTLETTIRVPGELRDRLKAEAGRRGATQADVIVLALRELKQAEFLRAVAAVEWDAEAAAEAREWDAADLGGDPVDPWAPEG